MTTKHNIDGKAVEVTTEWHMAPIGKFTVGVGPHTVTVKLDRGGKMLTDARYAIHDASVYEHARAFPCIPVHLAGAGTGGREARGCAPRCRGRLTH